MVRLVEVEAGIKAKEGRWLLRESPRLICYVLKTGCTTRRVWLADKPDDASERGVLLLSIQVPSGGCRLLLGCQWEQQGQSWWQPLLSIQYVPTWC